MENSVKKIAVLNIYQFPNGMAPTTRILAYTKGLRENGVDCDIVSFRPKDETTQPLTDECIGGNYYHFCYAPQGKIANLNRIFHSLYCRFYNLYCAIKAIKLLVKNHRTVPYSCCIVSVDALRQLFFFVPLLRLWGIMPVTIADEYPRPIRDKMKSSVPKLKLFLYKIVYRGVSGRILMTKYLQQFYDTQVSPKPTCIISTIVNTDRFRSVIKNESGSEYLCYMGNMSLAKDNVDNIIRAFSLISPRYPGLSLFLYGTPNNEDSTILRNLISDLGLQDKVIIKGRVRNDIVPQVLVNAKVLVTSQPNTKRAEGGFPTKMGEYMMTGVPSLLTDVGEIAQYVQDGDTCYIAPPENPEAYARKLDYILSNYSESLKVAERAKQYIIDNYASEKAGRDIVSFVNILRINE